MQNLKLPDKTQLMRWGGVALGVVVFLLSVKFCSGLFSRLGGDLALLKDQVAQAETLMDHTAQLDPKALERELEDLNGRLELPLEVSNVLEELGRTSEDKGVYISSVEPSSGENQEYVLVRMQVEGMFKALGEFLGAMDDMDSALARVRTFALRRAESGQSLTLSVTLELFRLKMEAE